MQQFRVRSKAALRRDLVTGVVLALLSVPLSMGFAMVAGLPPVYGIYGSLLTGLIFALLTGSPRYVFGVDAAPAALVGTLLPSLGIAGGSPEAVAVMPVFTLLTAAWLFLFWALRGGRYAKFISEPVLGGCVSGIACIVLLGRLPTLFGGSAASGRAPALLTHLLGEMSAFHPLSCLLGAGTLAVILLGRRWTRLSLSVIMMTAAVLSDYLLHWEALGVAVVGPLPAGLPSIARFDFSLLGSHAESFLVDSLAVALVIAAETLVSTREVARHYEEAVDGQKELLAYTLANLAAAFLGSSPASGSISRTVRVNRRQVSSQWMSVSACAATALVLLFGTPLLAHLPVPVLTGIVIASLITMLEFPMALRLWRLERSEFFIFTAAFGAELIGLAEGVIVGVLLSFASFTMRASSEPSYFLGVLRDEEGFHDLAQTPHARPIAQTVLYQFTGPMFFANAEDFERDILGALREDTRLVVVTGVSSLDMFAAERLLQLYRRLKTRGIHFYLSGHAGVVREQLVSYGAKELIRDGAVRQRLTQALAAGGVVPPYPLGNREKKKTQ